jgi:hypothetical protein
MSAWGDLQEKTLKNPAAEEVRGSGAGAIRRHRQELRQLSNPAQWQSQATNKAVSLHCTKIVQKRLILHSPIPCPVNHALGMRI